MKFSTSVFCIVLVTDVTASFGGYVSTWYAMGILFVWGKGNLDQISISCLHFEIVGQIQERMLALKLSWTVCLKLYTGRALVTSCLKRK